MPKEQFGSASAIHARFLDWGKAGFFEALWKLALASKVVIDYLESTDGEIAVEYLPGYAPELNPTEYVWGYMKQHELANLCRDTISEIQAFAVKRLRSMQRRVALVGSF